MQTGLLLMLPTFFFFLKDEHVHEKDSTSKLLQRNNEIHNTYKKVAEFLKQNENLKRSMNSMNELSKELCLKKENLTHLIENIKENMEGGRET